MTKIWRRYEAERAGAMMAHMGVMPQLNQVLQPDGNVIVTKSGQERGSG